MSLFSNRRRIVGAFMAASLIHSPAWAEPDPASTDEPAMLVTASRFGEALDEAFWSSSVLTRADIESRQATSFVELLAGLPGLGFNNSGGLGKATSIFMRGAEADHLLLLVDGVRMGSATLGIAPFEWIPVDQIERIEVVRGPRSNAYGSDAAAGVIQIFTRRGLDSGVRFGGFAGGGSHDLRRAGLDFRAGGRLGWLSLGAETLESKGFNSCNPLSAVVFAGCFADEPDRDGIRTRSLSFGAGGKLGERVTVQLRSMLTDGSSEFDGSFTNEVDIAQRVASLQFSAPFGAWRTQALFGWNEDVQNNFHDGADSDRYRSRRQSVGLQADGTLGVVQALLGADLQKDRIASTLPFEGDSRRTVGTFAELRRSFGAWSLMGGARFEDNQQFGTNVTHNLGVAHRFSGGQRVTLTWGTGFRAPTFNELYFPGFGNPDLSPEESEAVELGLQTASGPVQWRLNAYRIDFDSMISASVSGPENVARARVTGAELQGEWRHDQWTVKGQLTRMNPENRSQGAGGRWLHRRARLNGALEVRKDWSRAAAGVLGFCEGRRYDNPANTVTLGGYCTVDVTAEMRLGRDWRLQARAANLFDRDYETVGYFYQDGRNFSVTFRYQPQ